MAAGSKLIGEFLSELADDPDKLQAYLENPEQVMQEAGLTQEQRETLLSNDLNRVKQAIREEYGKAEVLMFIWVIGAAAPPQEED
jgi:hypothetical protein